MGFYDAFKDALNVAQKADNVELYRKLFTVPDAEHQRLAVIQDMFAPIGLGSCEIFLPVPVGKRSVSKMPL